MSTPLPTPFAYLASEPGPNILLAALADFGLREVPGAASAPRILKMAADVGASSYYHTDATPWCALALTAWATEAGFAPPRDPLAALSWLKFGHPVTGPAMLGDVLVKSRDGGGHVGLYVGENAAGTHYAVLGGNQGDCVCIAWFAKSVFTVRRCAWRVAQPPNVGRRVVASGPGAGGAVKQS